MKKIICLIVMCLALISTIVFANTTDELYTGNITDIESLNEEIGGNFENKAILLESDDDINNLNDESYAFFLEKGKEKLIEDGFSENHIDTMSEDFIVRVGLSYEKDVTSKLIETDANGKVLKK